MASAAVLKNNMVIGSVNANKRHWYKAAEALAQCRQSRPGRSITRRERPETYPQALHRDPDDIKVIIQFSEVSIKAHGAEIPLMTIPVRADRNWPGRAGRAI